MTRSRRGSNLMRALCAIAIVAMSGCAGSSPRYAPGASTDPTIRVLLAEVTGMVILEVNGPFSVRGAGMRLTQSDRAATVVIEQQGTSLQVHVEPDGTPVALDGDVDIVPTGGALVAYAGVSYHGAIRVKVAPGGRTFVMNVLPLETYLEGVVPHEIGNPGPDAYGAIQAQAIAARTYALTRMEEHRAEAFDVHAGVMDQVYRGTQREDQLANSAIRDTRGLVLREGRTLARTYYCATCGGHTSDISLVWPQREPASYLHGTLDRSGTNSANCAWVRNFRWRYEFTAKELGDILRVTLPAELGVPAAQVGSLVDLRIVGRSRSGRVRAVEIRTTQGSFRAENDRIRWVLKTDADHILPSTMFDFDIERRGNTITGVGIYGGGNGHGVGMCQNGAIGMARRGFTYRSILEHYYPGTSVVGGY